VLAPLTRNDLFFSPGYNSPLFCPCPFAFTVHDLNHIHAPQSTSTLKRLYYATVLKRACHRATIIFTVSEFTRTQIIEWSGVTGEKVFNVRCGVDPAYHPGGEVYKLPFPYLLCVSNRKPHKNEFRTVDAFAQAGLAGELRLVFTGNPTAELAEYIERRNLTARVHFLGFVPEMKLPSLYRGAEALVFVSLYEGFGLPLLEAMASGTPAITANTSALPEVAGDAALLVSPTAVDDIADAMVSITSNTELRRQLREKGLAQSAKFSWERTTAKVKELLVSRAQTSGRATAD
jgi:glycosyltransferase involved in cell wall biosynthesis